MLRTFVWLNIYLLLLIPLNLWLDANYFYLMEKPLNPSLYWIILAPGHLYFGLRATGHGLFCHSLRTYLYK